MQFSRHNFHRIQLIPGRSYGQGSEPGLSAERNRLLHDLGVRGVGADPDRGRGLPQLGPAPGLVLCKAPLVPQPVVQSQRRPLLGPSPG